MRQHMTLTGPSATLVAALQSGQVPATHLLGIRKSDIVDGQFEVIYVDTDVKLDAKLDIEVPAGLYGQNHVIALKGDDDTVQGYFLIENAAMPIEDANQIANILVAAYDETTGNVRGAKDGVILMPAIVDADRARIMLADGTFIDVDTKSDLGDDVKLTASIVGKGKDAKIILGAQDDTAIYTKPVSNLLVEAKDGQVESLGQYINLGENTGLKRISRAKDGMVAIDTDKGVIEAKFDEMDKLNLGEVKAHMDAGDDTLGTWDSIGDTVAVTDNDGNPVQVYTQPGANGALKLTFLPTKGGKVEDARA